MSNLGPRLSNPWSLYDELIAGVPRGIAIVDYNLGDNWSYINAECGCGIAMTVHGGAAGEPRSIEGMDLKNVCELSKSWNWEEATLGVAALNAYYTTPEKVRALGGVIDEGVVESGDASNPFKLLRDEYAGKRVCVVGHFPNVHAMDGCGELIVLERNCNSEMDTPDSACEYLMPEMDYVFITGTTLTNKTLPRLLTLSHDAITVITGPSAIPSVVTHDHGADLICGSVVLDPQAARRASLGGNKLEWREGIKKFCIRQQ